MCLNLEDTLRYFDSFNSKILIAKVIGFGNYDKYNEFFDMYSTEYMLMETINYYQNSSRVNKSKLLIK